MFCYWSAGDPHHDVPAPDELQAGLEDQDIQDVDGVAQVVGQQPQVDVAGGLVGEGPAHRDQPHVPVPGHGDEEQPQHVHQVCATGVRSHGESKGTDLLRNTTHLQETSVCVERC